VNKLSDILAAKERLSKKSVAGTTELTVKRLENGVTVKYYTNKKIIVEAENEEDFIIDSDLEYLNCDIVIKTKGNINFEQGLKINIPNSIKLSSQKSVNLTYNTIAAYTCANKINKLIL
jgi:hypothetical protein